MNQGLLKLKFNITEELRVISPNIEFTNVYNNIKKTVMEVKINQVVSEQELKQAHQQKIEQSIR